MESENLAGHLNMPESSTTLTRLERGRIPLFSRTAFSVIEALAALAVLIVLTMMVIAFFIYHAAPTPTNSDLSSAPPPNLTDASKPAPVPAKSQAAAKTR